MTPEEIADGLALWQEHRPQTAEDWIQVAERCVADPAYDAEHASPLFRALYLVVAEQRDTHRRIVERIRQIPNRP